MSDNNITEIGILSIISIISGLFIVLIKIIMKSKCSNFDCCFGMFKVQRDIDAENKIEIERIEHNIKSNDYINKIENNKMEYFI